MVQGFQRILAATIFFGTDSLADGKPLIDWARFHFFDAAHLWFNRAESLSSGGSRPQSNIVTLSESFYAEISKHPIPVEREAVALLANAPGALDLYVWLAWRSWAVKTEAVRVPLFGSGGLTSQLGAGEYTSNRYFRRKLGSWLRRVISLWPQCNARLSDNGNFLLIQPMRNTPPVVSAIC